MSTFVNKGYLNLQNVRMLGFQESVSLKNGRTLTLHLCKAVGFRFPKQTDVNSVLRFQRVKMQTLLLNKFKVEYGDL
jgi:hypothetical protein